MRRSTALTFFLCFVAACGATDTTSGTLWGSPGTADASTGTPSTVDGGSTVTTDGSAGGTVGGGDPTNETCEEHALDSNLSTPDMLIVLDRSGSMNPDNESPTDRWGGSRDAVVDVTAQFDQSIRFGLMTFPEWSATGSPDECASGTVNVPVGVGSGDQIASTLAGMDADGRTPTAPSLVNALAALGGNEPLSPDEQPVPKYVLLVTDGDPNCSGGGRGGGGADTAARQATIQAIEDLAAVGIKTFVVGFQTAGTEFAQQLDLMAAAGDTGAATHTSVNSGEDLKTVMTELAAGVASCSYVLDAPVADASYIAVEVNGSLRGLNVADNGWTLGADARTITLTGAACDEVQGGGTLSIKVSCTIVTVQ